MSVSSFLRTFLQGAHYLQAAVYGAGCWAQQESFNFVEHGLACSVSGYVSWSIPLYKLLTHLYTIGSGEYIVKEMLARSLCETVLQSPETDTHDILHRHLTRFQSTRLVLRIYVRV
jgi:taspase, threonine aspartase, 1